MRLGSIDSTKITEDVLLQADFLGMDRLLAAVKCVAYFNMNPNFTGSDEEAVAGFDLKYQGITEAFSLGVLPKYLTDQKGQKKEYASITIRKPSVAHGESCITEMYVDVHVLGNVFDPSVEESQGIIHAVPDCHHFLDALNWLHRHGYTVREKDTESIHKGSHSFQYLLFSKKLQQMNACKGLSSLIRTNTKAMQEDDCKQFAALVYSQHELTSEGRTDVQADVGNFFDCECSYYDGDTLIEETWLTQMSNREHNSLMCGMNWLHKEGYTTQEDALGALYDETVTSSEWNMDSTVRIYSRPL
jgi:hypothetical protein